MPRRCANAAQVRERRVSDGVLAAPAHVERAQPPEVHKVRIAQRRRAHGIAAAHVCRHGRGERCPPPTGPPNDRARIRPRVPRHSVARRDARPPQRRRRHRVVAQPPQHDAPQVRVPQHGGQVAVVGRGRRVHEARAKGCVRVTRVLWRRRRRRRRRGRAVAAQARGGVGRAHRACVGATGAAGVRARVCEGTRARGVAASSRSSRRRGCGRSVCGVCAAERRAPRLRDGAALSRACADRRWERVAGGAARARPTHPETEGVSE